MPGKVQPAKYTVAQRIAITECMSLVALLADAKILHAKALGVIVLLRIKTIGAEGASVLAAPNDEIARVVEVAKQFGREQLQ